MRQDREIIKVDTAIDSLMSLTRAIHHQINNTTPTEVTQSQSQQSDVLSSQDTSDPSDVSMDLMVMTIELTSDGTVWLDHPINVSQDGRMAQPVFNN